jgi:hypothetical protein
MIFLVSFKMPGLFICNHFPFRMPGLFICNHFFVFISWIYGALRICAVWPLPFTFLESLLLHLFLERLACPCRCKMSFTVPCWHFSLMEPIWTRYLASVFHFIWSFLLLLCALCRVDVSLSICPVLYGALLSLALMEPLLGQTPLTSVITFCGVSSSSFVFCVNKRVASRVNHCLCPIFGLISQSFFVFLFGMGTADLYYSPWGISSTTGLLDGLLCNGVDVCL